MKGAMNAQRAAEILAELQEKNRQRDRLMAELELWVKLLTQGFDSADVESLGWEEHLLTDAEKYAGNLPPHAAKRPEWAGNWRLNCGRPLWYNFVRLKTGEVRKLAPFLKAPERD